MLLLTIEGLDYRSVAIDLIMRCIEKGCLECFFFSAIEYELLPHLSVIPDVLYFDGILAVT